MPDKGCQIEGEFSRVRTNKIEAFFSPLKDVFPPFHIHQPYAYAETAGRLREEGRNAAQAGVRLSIRDYILE